MAEYRNRRETDVRKPHPGRKPDETDTDAALPAQPRPHGLTEPVDETQEKTRQSEGTNPPLAGR